MPSSWFVSCFSAEKDDLSQRRAYSGGENGYAIGFRLGACSSTPAGMMVRVSYDKEAHVSAASKLAQATVDSYRKGLQKRSGLEGARWLEDFIEVWDGGLSYLAPMMKDPAFRAEREYRLLHEYNPSEIVNLVFRQRQSLMSLHLPLNFSTSDVDSAPLPIAEVMVGPGRHNEISRLAVQQLVRQKGYDVPVTLSKIPFQTT